MDFVSWLCQVKAALVGGMNTLTYLLRECQIFSDQNEEVLCHVFLLDWFLTMQSVPGKITYSLIRPVSF